jgi:hypothetical protein
MRLWLKEEQIGVFTAVVREIVALTDGLRLTPKTIRQALELHIPVIIERLGDKKEAIASAAKEFVLWATQCDSLGLPVLGPHLLAPLKAPIVWSNVEEKLTIIQELLATRRSVGASFDCTPFSMRFHQT